MMIRSYRSLPDIVTGYPLDDVWSVLVPIARTNEVTNPSAETNTTGYTAGAGTLTRTTEQQYHGAYSFKYVPGAAITDGFYYSNIQTQTGQLRAVSCKFRGYPNVPYIFSLNAGSGIEQVAYSFKGTGRWQWVWCYFLETTPSGRRLYFRKNNSADTHAFYVDGVQSEVINAGETVSTYIDGDQVGLVPNQQPTAYFWNGTPHASSSTRSSQTRAGGMAVPFSKYNFLLTALIGLGLATPQNIATDYARIDGSYDDYTRKPSRQFTITGRFQGRTYAELRRNRSGLAQLFDRDLTGQDQRLTLLRHVEDGNGRVLSSDIRLHAKYESGFGGSTDNMHAETVPITFTLYMPNLLADGEDGEALNVQTSIASNANGILQRSPAGVWSSMGSVTGGFGVYSIVRGLDGLIYVGGDFTPAPATSVASWNPLTSAFSAMGSGASGGFVYQLAVLPSGNIIAAGTFTGMGGVANTNKIAMWAGSWSSISSGFVGTEIRTVAVAPNGILYVGGVFTSIGGVAATNVTSYNPATGTWAAVGAGIAAGGVTSLAISGTNIYAAVESQGVYKSTGGNFSSIGTASGGDAQSLAIDAAGNLYAGGAFTSIGGVTAARIARYNGVTWFPLGSGLNNSINLRAMSFDNRGLLYVGGDFTTAGGITTPTGSAVWNGSAWVYPDIIPAATAHMYGALALPNGQFYQGTINGGSAIGPGTTTVTNTGTAKTYPTLVIKGPSSGTARIYSLVNATTGRLIYLNLTINAGETVTMNFQPDNLSFVSDFQGNIAGAILGGSNEADFFLQPGANSIAFLAGSSTVTATLQWRPAYASIDDVP